MRLGFSPPKKEKPVELYRQVNSHWFFSAKIKKYLTLAIL